jgi:hypothetical protein
MSGLLNGINNLFKTDLVVLNLCFYFAPVLSIFLIKKGRGYWPDEALATSKLLVKTQPQRKVLNPYRQ